MKILTVKENLLAIPNSPSMKHTVILHDTVFFYILLIFYFTTALLLLTILWFKKNKNTTPTHLKYPVIVEIIWTILPIITLFAIVVPSFNLLYAQDESMSPELNVKVTGLQWYWNYEYVKNTNPLLPVNAKNKELNLQDLFLLQYGYKDASIDSDSLLDKLAPFYTRLLATTVNLELPTDTYIRFLVTSNDVIHSWAVPSLGIKLDAVPGRINTITTIINREGIYYGQCSEICGANHGFMPITILATPIFTIETRFGVASIE